MGLTDEALGNFGPLGLRNKRHDKGRGAKLGPNTEQGVRARLWQAKADHELGESLGQCVTITCALGQVGYMGDDPGEPLAFRVEGEIQWGNDGAAAVARFDWKNGTCVRVVGGSFSLTAELLAPLTGSALYEDITVEVASFVGYVPNGQAMAPTLTARQLSVGGAPVSFSVPAFAQKAVILYQGNIGSVTWAEADGAVLGTTAAGTNTGVPGQFGFWVPNGAAILQVTPAVDSAVVVMWELAL